MRAFKKSLLAAATASCFAVPTLSHAAAFGLIENSTSAMGNAFAGAAASAEDASTVWFNPAGMSLINKTQAVGAAHVIDFSAKFRNNGSTGAYALGTQTDGGDAGGANFVPNAYFITPLGNGFMAGVGINAPFGLKTEYSNDFRGAVQALKSDIKTVNINPSVSVQMNDQLALGFGVNVQRIDAELTQALGVAPGAAQLKIKGNDTAYGVNFGGIYTIDPTARVGLAYRSSISYTVEGNADNGATGTSTPIRSRIRLPYSVSLSGTKALDKQWTLLADLTYTGWSSIQELRFDNRDTGALFGSDDYKWKNTYRVSFGATYQYNDRVKLKSGIAYDQSPVRDDLRGPRLPDSDRTWLSIGSQYTLNAHSRIDLAYSHLFIKDSSVSKTATGVPGTLIGNFNANVNLYSIQYTHTF